MELQEISGIVNKVCPEQINLNSFNFKKELNPKIWNNGKLISKIRNRLLKIAKEFVDFTDLDFIPIDVILVGSIASFNWSKYSDIDLHILADFSKINDNVDLVNNYLYTKKWEWNETHKNLNIYGYDVELYVQNITDENASNGIYSIKYNHWLKIPDAKHKKLDKNLIKEVAAQYINKIEYYNRKFDELKTDRSFLLLQSKVNYLYDLIIQGRKKSLPVEGEQAAGNIIFKVLRRSGHLEMINDLKTKIFDKINSIEENYKVVDSKLINDIDNKDELNESLFNKEDKDIIDDNSLLDNYIFDGTFNNLSELPYYKDQICKLGALMFVENGLQNINNSKIKILNYKNPTLDINSIQNIIDNENIKSNGTMELVGFCLGNKVKGYDNLWIMYNGTDEQINWCPKRICMREFSNKEEPYNEVDIDTLIEKYKNSRTLKNKSINDENLLSKIVRYREKVKDLNIIQPTIKNIENSVRVLKDNGITWDNSKLESLLELLGIDFAVWTANSTDNNKESYIYSFFYNMFFKSHILADLHNYFLFFNIK